MTPSTPHDHEHRGPCYILSVGWLCIFSKRILGEKASTLTTANLKAFVSKTKKKEKEGLSTNVRESDIVFDCSTADGSLKRKRGDGSLRALDLTGVKEDARAFTAEEICSAHESQVMLHGYRDGPERSLWSTGYPFMVVSDEFAQVDSDVKIIHEAGKTGVARYLQVIGARLMSIGRTSELDSILEGDNVAAIKKLKASLQEKDEKVLKLRNELKATREIKRGRY
ncbi:uncharacterized protein LOC107618874 isoform X1 [Arachis ipaensis]|nr:uncharacterized protein LOC107618874 isoform X1 [Arachis ipaensis]XP_020966108.1 uncharacterized protein LOC107618874 isoform X1 [Arachis ipaensis]XP_025675030.1 uncharacterized protein LOC112775548 isoform X1 [Arachis hypogaea]